MKFCSTSDQGLITHLIIMAYRAWDTHRSRNRWLTTLADPWLDNFIRYTPQPKPMADHTCFGEHILECFDTHRSRNRWLTTRTCRRFIFFPSDTHRSRNRWLTTRYLLNSCHFSLRYTPQPKPMADHTNCVDLHLGQRTDTHRSRNRWLTTLVTNDRVPASPIHTAAETDG